MRDELDLGHDHADRHDGPRQLTNLRLRRRQRTRHHEKIHTIYHIQHKEEVRATTLRSELGATTAVFDQHRAVYRRLWCKIDNGQQHFFSFFKLSLIYEQQNLSLPPPLPKSWARSIGVGGNVGFFYCFSCSISMLLMSVVPRKLRTTTYNHQSVFLHVHWPTSLGGPEHHYTHTGPRQNVNFRFSLQTSPSSDTPQYSFMYSFVRWTAGKRTLTSILWRDTTIRNIT